MERSVQMMSANAVWADQTKGKEATMVGLYETFYADLFNYGFKICNNREMTADAIQELFMEMWLQRDHFLEVRDKKPYLLRVLRNVILDQLKKDQRFKIELPFLQSFPEIHFSPEDLIAMEEQGAHVSQILADTLNRLPARQKEIIYLRFYNDLDYGEIAQVTGLGYQSVRNAVHKALKNIRKKMR